MERKRELRRVGLARALSKLGYCSRSKGAELIRAGRVRLNGATRRDPETPVRLGRDRIEVDGSAVKASADVYLILNKPRGVVTTAADEKSGETVYSLFPGGLPFETQGKHASLDSFSVKVEPAPVLGDDLPWVGPVGRLDKASEGLLLLTNDSEWAARITDPHSHLDKIYHVQVRGVPTATLVGELTAGVPATTTRPSFAKASACKPSEGVRAELMRGVRDNNELLRAKKVRVLRTGERNTWLEMVLDEGKNRQIRRMLERQRIEVLRLIRVAIGPVALGDLAKGKFRRLTPAEKLELDRALEAANG